MARREPDRKGGKKGAREEEAASAPETMPWELRLRGVMASAAALAIPGLGHAVLGKVPRGLVLFVAIEALLALGIANQGALASPRSGEPLTYLATFGNLGIGPAYFVLRGLGIGAGNADHPTYEYGSTFILSAGLLNFLVMLDAFDIAVGNRHATPANAPSPPRATK